ncbi:hypothetical protein Pmar_PMAR028896 [Perkinsus marinus ATCC 50983]|uniref:Uncharacterized protein n=1 Tax=Perkinsus marinus (strain ATCC 50983 / TXsc) TaxID=423536 RepID=C5LXI8_PERM5|nr:hypothetical protein Pmar_PMAR028896 [Perkinsus marinus ATCC 50983]EEQ98554.1 hypothetical protein Pmar_PMAR028896 [Perkinsus marinus ATCC 50983]|eukprot:XP_002765837.1 hypothetical protein Pmar_PMAR028896 [Perkinsus marinus ATCC 50983]
MCRRPLGQVKGKAKVKVAIDLNADGTTRESWSSKSAVKKVYYTLTINGVEFPVEVNNHKWQNWGRDWDIPGMS